MKRAFGEVIAGIPADFEGGQGWVIGFFQLQKDTTILYSHTPETYYANIAK